MLVELNLPETTAKALVIKAVTQGLSLTTYLERMIASDIEDGNDIDAFVNRMLTESRSPSLRKDPTPQLADVLGMTSGKPFDASAFAIEHAEFEARVREVADP